MISDSLIEVYKEDGYSEEEAWNQIAEDALNYRLFRKKVLEEE